MQVQLSFSLDCKFICGWLVCVYGNWWGKRAGKGFPNHPFSQNCTLGNRIYSLSVVISPGKIPIIGQWGLWVALYIQDDDDESIPNQHPFTRYNLSKTLIVDVH
jgi:hypothetical protein